MLTAQGCCKIEKKRGSRGPQAPWRSARCPRPFPSPFRRKQSCCKVEKKRGSRGPQAHRRELKHPIKGIPPAPAFPGSAAGPPPETTAAGAAVALDWGRKSDGCTGG